MNLGGVAETPQVGCRRRLLAAALCPLLGAMPMAALGAWDGMEMSSTGPIATLWDYTWNSVVFAYLFAAPTGAIVWFLMRWTNAPLRAWVVVPLFSATCAVLMAASVGSWAALMGGVVFGAPISVAYCLVAGVPWRRRDEAPSRPAG